VTSGAHRSLLLQEVDGWAGVSVFKTGVSLVQLRGPEPNPISNGFDNFQNEPSYKLGKPTLCCSKNYSILHADRIEDREQLSF
jgi:hypothetical protein